MFDPNELSARFNRKTFLFYLIFTSIPLVGVSYSFLTDPAKEVHDFKKSPVALSMLMAFLLFIFIFFCYRYLNKKIQLQINKEGIWTPKKKLISWSNIWYLYFKETKGKYDNVFLIVKIIDPEDELKVELGFLDKSEEEILDAITKGSAGHNIQFMDREIVG